MTLAHFTPWPQEDRNRYIEAGYWQRDSLGELLRGWAESFSERIALIDGHERWSYKTLDQKADRLAAGLHKHGLKSGDKVLVQMPNSNNFIALCFVLGYCQS